MLCPQATVYVEGVAQKMRRQVEDLDRGSSTPTPSLSVDGVSLESYITRWGAGRGERGVGMGV